MAAGTGFASQDTVCHARKEYVHGTVMPMPSRASTIGSARPSPVSSIISAPCIPISISTRSAFAGHSTSLLVIKSAKPGKEEQSCKHSGVECRPLASFRLLISIICLKEVKMKVEIENLNEIFYKHKG